jgi:hypothetical protein
VVLLCFQEQAAVRLAPTRLPTMNSNNFLLWFLIVGGFVTAGVGVLYFLSGESSNASDGQNYSVFVQIVLGGAVTLYGTRKYCEEPAGRRD